MMKYKAYADIDKYTEIAEKYGLDLLCTSEKSITQSLNLATVKIDELTFGRISQMGFDNLTEYQKEKVSEAVCVQAEYIAEEGFSDGVTIDSYSVLDISVSVSSSKSESERLGVSPFALSLLRQSGLMERVC